MKRGWILLPFLLAVALLGLFALRLASGSDETHPSRLVGQAMPGIALGALLPSHPPFAPATGAPRLVNIFASWCVPCAAEAPVLERLKARGVTIDGIAVRDTREDAERFLARYGDPYRQVGDDPDSRAQLALGSSGVPESFVVDAKGRIRYQHIGPIMPQDEARLFAEWRKAQ